LEIKWANIILGNISQSYGLESVPKADPSIISPAARGTWATYATVNRTVYFAEDSLAKYFVSRTGWTRAKAKQLAENLVSAEVERQALSTYVLYQAMRVENKLEKNFDITTVDSKLDEFESHHAANDTMRTTLVSRISDLGDSIDDVRDCENLKLTLVSRELSLTQSMYREKLQAHCKDNRTFTFDWVGTIPLPFQPVLQRHPRTLDLIGTSLAIRELLRMRPVREPSVDAVDLVRNEPRKTIPVILAAMSLDVMPRELLAKLYSPHQQATAALQFILSTREDDHQPPLPNRHIIEPTWLPDTSAYTKERFHLGYPGGVSMFHGMSIVKPDEYRQRISTLKDPISKMLSNYAQRRALQQFRDWYDQNVSDKNDCNWMDVLCDVGLLRSDNETKKWSLKNLDDELRKLDGNTLYWHAWDLTPIAGGKASDAQIRELIVKSDGSGFFELFELLAPNGEVVYAPIENTAPMPPWLISLIQQEGKNSPTFFGLDPGLNFDGEIDRFAAAWLLCLQSRILAERNRVPIAALEDFAGSTYAVHLADDSLFAPILDSAAGRLRALEATLWNAGIESARVSTLLPNRGPLKDQLAQTAWSNWQTMIAQVNAAANAKATENEDHFKNDTPFTFGVTLSIGQGPLMIGPMVSLGSNAVSVVTNFNGGWVISGKINNQSIPSISFVTNLSASPEKSGEWSPMAGYSTRIQLTAVEEGTGVARFALRKSDVGQPDAGSKPSGSTEPWESVFPGQFSGPLKNSVEIESGDLPSLGYIIARAAPKLSDEQLNAIHESVKLGYLPAPLVDHLIDIGNEVLDEEKIEKHEWFETSVSDTFGVPKNINVKTSEYLDKRNAEYSRAFRNEVARVQQKHGVKNIFPAGEGKPVTRLVYSDNFAIMTFVSEYQTIYGEVIRNTFSTETPWYALSKVRADPTGHVIEKIDDAIVSDFLGKATEFEKNPLRIAGYVENQGDRDLGKELGDLLGDKARELSKQLESGFKAYMQDLDNWLKSHQTDSDVADPFVPTPEEVQFSYILPSTDRLSHRRDEKLYNVMLKQDSSTFIGRIRSGELRPVTPTALP
jgi:hypothetical protein